MSEVQPSTTADQQQQQQQQQLATNQPNAAGGVVATTTTTTLSSVKTVKQTKKVTSSKRSSSSSTTKKTTSTTSSAGDGAASNASTSSSQVIKREQQCSTMASTTSTTSTATAAGEVQTKVSSSSSAVLSASRSIVVKESGKTFSQHLASITGASSLEGLGNVAAVAAAKPTLQLLVSSDDAEVQPIRLKAEDLIDRADGGGKGAVLSFDVSEFESQSLEVTMDGNKVKVNATKKHVNPEGEERSEQFSRVYELPSQEALDPEKVTTSVFQDGVLTVELPVGCEAIVTLAPEGDELVAQQ